MNKNFSAEILEKINQLIDSVETTDPETLKIQAFLKKRLNNRKSLNDHNLEMEEFYLGCCEFPDYEIECPICKSDMCDIDGYVRLQDVIFPSVDVRCTNEKCGHKNVRL